MTDPNSVDLDLTYSELEGQLSQPVLFRIGQLVQKAVIASGCKSCRPRGLRQNIDQLEFRLLAPRELDGTTDQIPAFAATVNMNQDVFEMSHRALHAMSG